MNHDHAIYMLEPGASLRCSCKSLAWPTTAAIHGQLKTQPALPAAYAFGPYGSLGLSLIRLHTRRATDVILLEL